ncbi:MAG: DoxX family protein [Pseudolabrys sp.]
MTDSTVLELDASQAITAESAALPMARLADRLATLVPPLAAAELAKPLPLPSPAVQAALEKSRKKAAKAARRAMRPRSRWFVGRIVDSFVSACAFIPYALVGLGLRLVMARLFFFDGQTRIDGPRVPLNVRDFDLSVVLPLHPKLDTFTAFMTKYATVPVSPVIGAYLLSYAEFLLPIMLVLGFGTRFAAFGLLIMTAIIQVYVMPEALWTTHVYWASVLMVLLSLGPGQISVDHLIRFIARR